MAFNLSKRPNVKIGIEMVDFCQVADANKIKLSVIRAVDEIESAGSGFLSGSKRPKILFEGHYFYKFLAKHGLAEKARKLEPTICYPKWVKTHYRGREGEYARIAKATELCHKFDLSDALALRSASWGRYQIMGENFKAAGFNTVEDFVEAMFQDEDRHLQSFIDYINYSGLIDELQKLPSNPLRYAALFAGGYNGPGYRRNAYDTKIVAAFKRFDKIKVDCSTLKSNRHVVTIMPGIRAADPAEIGFQNTSLDDRYLDVEGEDNLLEIDPPSGNDGSGDPSDGDGGDSSAGNNQLPNQSADVITNIDSGAPAEAKVIEAAKNLPDTTVEVKSSTGFLAKIGATVTAILTGQYVFPEFLQHGLSGINLIDLLGKLFAGLWNLRYIIVSALALWFVVNQIKDFLLKNQAIRTNTDPMRGNVNLVTPNRVGIYGWIRNRFMDSRNP